MSEPIYIAKTWRDSAGGWRWQTLKDGAEIPRRGASVGLVFGVPSRAEALARARHDMEWDRDCGVEEIVLNPEVIPEPEVKTETPPPTRAPGLYVVTTSPPGPNSEFVELEDQDGHGVGPLQSGAEWREEGDYWTFGPLAPVVTDEQLEQASAYLLREPLVSVSGRPTTKDACADIALGMFEAAGLMGDFK